MANTVIAVRSSGTAAATPSLGVIANGEIALNFADGIIYYKTSSNTLGSIRTTQPAGLTTEVQYNDAGSFGANANFTFNKTTATLNVAKINVTSTTVSTSNTTGAIIVAGGVGVKGNVYADAIYDGGVEVITFAQAAYNQANNALANTGTSVTANNLTQYTFANTTASTSNTTGALKIAGGIGVKGNVYADNVFIGGQQAGTVGDAMAMAIALG